MNKYSQLMSFREYCGFHVVFLYDALCFRIEKGYSVKSKEDILKTLEVIHLTPEYETLVNLGYTRTIDSEYREWCAHNVLYKLGILRSRTGTVDFGNNESKIRRFGYTILSIF